MTVRFVAEAREEFLDAIRYYEGAESGLGRRFRCELEAAVLATGLPVGRPRAPDASAADA